MEKLEWCGYVMVKKFEDMFIHFKRIYKCDRRMDRQIDTAQHRAVKTNNIEKTQNI